MITAQDIEQLHAIAATVLRKHGGNVGQALSDFLYAQADAGLGPEPDDNPVLPAVEYAAREYLTAYAKEKLDGCED